MKCPHCEYEHIPEGWDEDSGEWIPSVGDKEGFYKLPIQMERTENAYYDSLQRIALYACPSCCKTFVEG